MTFFRTFFTPQARAAGLTLAPFPPEPEGEAVRRLAASLTELATRLAAFIEML